MAMTASMAVCTTIHEATIERIDNLKLLDFAIIVTLADPPRDCYSSLECEGRACQEPQLRQLLSRQ